jgi:DMSO/TMAO reductase YedYZ molybdopterin-dependent catalytic subunit
VVGIFDALVQYSPNSVVTWSRETFGLNQKPVTVTGITLVTLLLGAAFAVAALRDRRVGIAGFVAFGVVGGWAAARSPLGSAGLAWLSAALAVAVGVATLLFLLRSLPFAPSGLDLPERLVSTPERRHFLGGAGAAVFWGAFGSGLGRLLRQRHSVEDDRARVAATLADGLSGTDGGALATPDAEASRFDALVDGISPLVTPNDEFYRIDTALVVPQVELDGWKLTIKGMVRNEIELTFADLAEMAQLDEHVTLSCVSNEVGGSLVGNARWTGVSLPALLDMAGVEPGATQIVGRSVDGWTAGFPTEIAYDGRPAMVALTMNGEPLPVAHGFPARLVVPGLYGYVSATKWLEEIELTTWEDFDAYWIPRGWSKLGPIKTQSRIDVPRKGATVSAGRTAVAGVAWGGDRSVDAVEVRVDSGPWMAATLSEELAESSWRQWFVEWDAVPGRHEIQVRATDGGGTTQTVDRAPPAPSGATGYHTVEVDVQS